MVTIINRTPKNYNVKFSTNFSKISLVILLSLGIPSLSQASIVIDINAEENQQPTLTENNSATTVVNIQTANAMGISHNKYTQFDVDTKGVVLNNFVNHQTNENINYSITLSPLDGHGSNYILVTSNPSLRESGPARIILNEVTSLAGPSQLNGPIAIAGQKADIIIANPAGIECNGCGFINTRIGNLSAYSPLLTDGSVKFLSNNINSEITFSGIGLSKEANQSDYTTLIASKININAPVHANKGLYAKIFGDKDSMHTASLNLSELGGMYANKIFIRNSGQNIGVHNKGEIKAEAGLLLQVSDLLDSPGVISSAEYLDLASENFNMVFVKDENYSQAHIFDNIMTKKSPQGNISTWRSIYQDFSPKLQLVEQNKVKEINTIGKYKDEVLEHEILPVQNKYMLNLNRLPRANSISDLTMRFRFLDIISKSKDEYFLVKEKYDRIGVNLDTAIEKFKESFTNSDYSYYQSMSDGQIDSFIYHVF